MTKRLATARTLDLSCRTGRKTIIPAYSLGGYERMSLKPRSKVTKTRDYETRGGDLRIGLSAELLRDNAHGVPASSPQHLRELVREVLVSLKLHVRDISEDR